MRVFLLGVRITALACLVVLASCTRKQAESKSVQELQGNPAQTAATASVASAQKCEDGQAVKVIAGDCSGVWSIKKTDGVLNCEFEWKPKVTCPTGTTAVGLEAACYGVTIRPADANVKTVADCSAAHGKFPISPAYKLECCP